MEPENYYMSRCDREFFEEFASVFHDIMKRCGEANERLGGRYTPLEAYATTLAEALDVDEKCRIVIEYDPAGNKVATYREELTGRVKSFKDHQDCQGLR